MTARLSLTIPFILLNFVLLPSATNADEGEKPVLRVVYFTPNDREPIPGYVDRLDKVLEHIREFFRDGMEEAGYGARTFELDRKEDGTLRVFVVRGEHPTEHYGRESGWQVQQECQKALMKERVNLQQETAVVLNNLLLWKGDKNIEHGPYAGGGNHMSGFAWAYDDAMLDPEKLGSKEPGGYFHEPCSVGRFNSLYIGGIAHELGHGLGLPHVCQKEADRERGTALMGAGNHTWGRELRGEGTGTFLTTASAMQLSRNRLFAGELKERQRRPTCRLEFRGEQVGWRRPMRDRIPRESGGGCFLEVGGKFAERGLYAHAPSRYTVQTGKAWKRLTAEFGLQTGHPGSVVFVVRGDGRELFRSETVADQNVRSIDIGISGVDVLELIVENAGNGNAGDWGIWLDPMLKR